MTEQQTNYETGEILTAAPQVDPKDQAALFAKVAKVMGKLERLPRSGHNDHFNYDFVTDGDVSDAVRAALASENVAFFASMRHTQVDAKKTTAYFTYTFADGETGATWSCDWVGEAIDGQDKGTAKAATSALKYFLMKNFVLSSGDPADDTDEAKPAPAKRASKPKASNNGTEEAKAEFFAGVLKDIPFYENVDHIGNALKAAGFTAYAKSKETKMLAALKKHANEAANKEAA
jgi:hypothetical protein